MSLISSFELTLELMPIFIILSPESCHSLIFYILTPEFLLFHQNSFNHILNILPNQFFIPMESMIIPSLRMHIDHDLVRQLVVLNLFYFLKGLYPRT